MRIPHRLSLFLLVSVPLALVFISGSQTGNGATPPPDLAAGDPLPRLTKAQYDAFQVGKADFAATEDFEDGLGPVFNGTSCAECHAKTAVGGAGTDLKLTRITLFGCYSSGQFDPMVEWGGLVIQRRSLAEFYNMIPVAPEVVPSTATVIAHRITTPLFGLGLIEAVSEPAIRRAADPNDRNHDGISGRVNMVFNPETGKEEIGRFGWKASVPTIHLFAGLAYRNEMGIRNPSFPEDNLPQGQPIQSPMDPIKGLEDDGTGVNNLTTFMRLLAPLGRATSTTSQIATGETVFAKIGCVQCHTPSLKTDTHNPVPVLRNKEVPLYSDLLVHDMGPGLADNMPMESATGSEWRTAPLWGVSRRSFLLHDGRARSFEAAITAHGGEATSAASRFVSLSPKEREALIAFLRSL